MTAQALAGVDPALVTQRAFRALMQALARPGRPLPLAGIGDAPAALGASLAAAALTLIDYETPVWLAPRLRADAATRDWLAFHTGAPVTDRADAAAFALVSDPAECPSLCVFGQGDDDYPDRSTTVLLATGGFAQAPLTLAGPGIDGTIGFGFAPMPATFRKDWAMNGALYPRGIDVLLFAGDAVAGLPRTTRIVEG